LRLRWHLSRDQSVIHSNGKRGLQTYFMWSICKQSARVSNDEQKNEVS
jgi:hypothetical protein